MKRQFPEATDLLWTGGWDSTFRLLQLLLVLGVKVQPYYIIDKARRSTDVEIRTIKVIKEQLFAKYPQTRELLLETKFTKVSDLRPNPELTAVFERLLKHKYIGSQYEWLARFCSENEIEGMELSIHRDDKAHELLEPFVQQVQTELGTCYKLNKELYGSEEYKLFRYFKFPLFDLSKRNMQNVAKNHGFEDLMNLTWFCHAPRANSQPCGVCNPCIYTIEEGLWNRVPLSGRIRYHLRIRPRVTHLLMNYPKIYGFARSMKRRMH